MTDNAKAEAEWLARWEDEEDGRRAHPMPLGESPRPCPVRRDPPVGSWASVARMMAANDDSGFDWDAWKDEMKESA